MSEEQEFHHTALSEGRAAAQQQNPSHNHTTIPPFETNKSLFLLSNATANEQKAITAMYTEAEIEGKTIHLILNSGSAGSIITYQLMQQLKRNVDRPAQIVIVTANGMKKTPVGEIDNFPFTLDGIIIPVKVLVMDAFQYQALVRNDWLNKANANLNCETQELTIFYEGQHAQPWLLNLNWKKKNPSLKHSWLLDQHPTEPIKQNKNILPCTLNPKPLDGIYLTQNPNQGNNAPIFSFNIRTATRNYYQWEPAFHLKKNMKIIPVITARLATKNDGAI
ncbi:hypothetical protein G9A89_017675 [Geosiphon pyriformis]|nr:hypothetical protein G9A89_017675 [Geosiphon pyriformis]